MGRQARQAGKSEYLKKPPILSEVNPGARGRGSLRGRNRVTLDLKMISRVFYCPGKERGNGQGF
jgi:hypothetical protein